MVIRGVTYIDLGVVWVAGAVSGIVGAGRGLLEAETDILGGCLIFARRPCHKWLLEG